MKNQEKQGRRALTDDQINEIIKFLQSPDLDNIVFVARQTKDGDPEAKAMQITSGCCLACLAETVHMASLKDDLLKNVIHGVTIVQLQQDGRMLLKPIPKEAMEDVSKVVDNVTSKYENKEGDKKSEGHQTFKFGQHGEA